LPTKIFTDGSPEEKVHTVASSSTSYAAQYDHGETARDDPVTGRGACQKVCLRARAILYSDRSRTTTGT
jgi:hypothetical protein